jgi:hypothetical protein
MGKNMTDAMIQAKRQRYVNAGTIWAFWDGHPPDLILRCIETVRAQNRHRPVVILSKDTLSLFLDPCDYPTFYDEKNSSMLRQGTVDDFSSVQYLADWVRITLLEKYGGVWFDASVICTSAVENWMSTIIDADGGICLDNKITMFPMHANPKVHGNWSMAVTRKGHPLLKAWREEFASILKEAGPRSVPTKFCTDAFEIYPNLHDIWYGQSYSSSGPPLPYLWVYLCLQVVLQKQPELKSTIFLRTSIDGPMYRRYVINIEDGITDAAEISKKTAEHLANEPLHEREYDRFFIKLVGSDREPIQRCMDGGSYKEGSAIDSLCRVPRRSIKFGSYLRRSTRPVGLYQSRLLESLTL